MAALKNKTKENPRIIERPVSGGRVSLILEYYYGYEEKIDKKTRKRKIKHHREKRSLNLYLVSNPKTPADRVRNNEIIALARSIRLEEEQELAKVKQGYRLPSKNINLFDTMQKIAKDKDKESRDLFCAFGRFKRFYISLRPKIKTLQPHQFTPELLQKYADHLQLVCKGEGARTSFKRLSQIIRELIKQGIITKNPAEGIKCKNNPTKEKEVLTPNEIGKLYSLVDFGEWVNIRKSFIFSLYTGLRHCDVRLLTFENVDFENKTLTFVQSKTGGKVTTYLHTEALEMIGPPKAGKTNIFDLPSATKIATELKIWVAQAGIDKKITFHCARHSFATNLAAGNVELFTIKNLMGHTDIKNTLRYARQNEPLKRQAVEILPTFHSGNSAKA